MRLLFVAIAALATIFAANDAAPLTAAAQDFAAADRAPTSPASDWRRTALGWERRSWFCERATVEKARFGDFPHPAVIAALQALLSLAALVAWSSKPPAKPSPKLPSKLPGDSARR